MSLKGFLIGFGQCFIPRALKLGILDIGSNSIHMVLVEIGRDLSVTLLDRAKEMIQLGDTSFQDGTLSDLAVERGLVAVRRFKKLSDLQGIQKIKAVATSAVREAVNGGDFLEKIRVETGVKVQVITGEEEARLIWMAVKHSLHFTKKPALIVDIGGGSVELIVANDKGLLHSWSLKLGTLRLRGEFIRKDPPSKKELQKMQKHIQEMLEPLLKKIRSLSIESIIGTSGTIMNLVSMAHWQDHTTPIEILNHYRIPSSSLLDLHELLIQTDRKERLKIKGIDPERIDFIIPGSSVLHYLIREGNTKDVILCDEAIREGLIYDYLEKNKSKIELENRIPDIRQRSIVQLAKRCDYQEKHAQHVKELALSLFDQTLSLHKLGPREREFLGYASLLHDIGYHISYRKHHRHTYYLIKNGDLNGFEEREIEVIANIARYHCKSAPKKSHDNWEKLSSKDRKIVKSCAAILKLADALDRTHFSVVRQVDCSLKKGRLETSLHSVSDPEMEIWTANRKKDLFEKVFQRKVIFNLAQKARVKKKLSRRLHA